MDIIFIDTCILDEILEIPGKTNAEKSKEIKQEFAEKCHKGYKFIIPFAVMLELGNHIAQIHNDTERKRCAEHFCEFLTKSVNDQNPWTIDCSGYDKDNIQFLADNYQKYADMEIGVGDINIVYQCMEYREKTVPIGNVEIWSLDHHIDTVKIMMGFYQSNTSPKRNRRR